MATAIQQPSRRSSRSLKLVLLSIGAALGLSVAFTLWTHLRTTREEGRIIDAQAWCDAAVAALGRDPRFANIKIGVPRRYYAFSPPSWFISVAGAVLDDAADLDLRARIAALRPPKEPDWHVINCRGDSEALKALAGDN